MGWILFKASYRYGKVNLEEPNLTHTGGSLMNFFGWVDGREDLYIFCKLLILLVRPARIELATFGFEVLHPTCIEAL
jgi:hypothetical protein